MKKSIIFLGVLLATIAAYTAFWFHLAHKAETQLRHAIVSSQHPNKALEFDADIQKSGYPTKVRLDVRNIVLTWQDPRFSERLSLVSEGVLHVEVPLWMPDTLFMHSKEMAMVADIPAVRGEEESEQALMMTFTWQDLFARNPFDNLLKGETRIHGLEATIGGAEQPITLTVEALKAKRDLVLSKGLISGSSTVSLENMGMTIGDLHVPLERYNVDISVDKFPDVSFMQESLQEWAQRENGATINTTELKENLKQVITLMAENRSFFTVHDISLKGKGFNLALNGHLEVQDNRIPQGRFELLVRGHRAILSAIPEENLKGSPLVFLALAQDPMNLSVAFNDGFLTFNGQPLLPLIPLDELVNSIPDEVQSTRAASPQNGDKDTTKPVPPAHIQLNEKGELTDDSMGEPVGFDPALATEIMMEEIKNCTVDVDCPKLSPEEFEQLFGVPYSDSLFCNPDEKCDAQKLELYSKP